MIAVILDALAQCPGSGCEDTGDLTTLLVLANAVGLWQSVRYIWSKKGASTMSKAVKIAIVLVIAAAALAGVVTMRDGPPSCAAPQADAPQAPGQTTAQPTSGIPRLVDLGAKSCIPCKMMAPILDELKNEYAGKFDVEFIDVWVQENAAKAKQYGIRAIPTQIFFDASGKELWRHEGFLSKEDILAKWRDLGHDFDGEKVRKSDTDNRDAPPVD